MVENRSVGIKSRELYEAPGMIALIEAHRALEDLVLTKGELHAKRELEPRWASLVYGGGWFKPPARGLRRVLRGHAGARRAARCGSRSRPARRSSRAAAREHALYAETLASYATGETFPHGAAEGFIRLTALETELVAARRRALVEA